MSPSTARNKDPILEVLRPHLAPSLRILEIASGTGEHAVHMTTAVPGLIWQPSDPSSEARASIAAWVAWAENPHLKPPLEIDATEEDWPGQEPESLDGTLSINMIHIAPIEAAKGVLKGAGRYLKPGGFHFFYGPYKVDGEHTAPSNAAFDETLRARDPRWGIRDRAEIVAMAEAEGLELVETHAMPANNFALLFRKRS